MFQCHYITSPLCPISIKIFFFVACFVMTIISEVYFAGFDGAHLFAHADLHDGIADERLSEIMVFLLFEPLNVHPCTFHKLTTKKTNKKRFLV